MILIYTCAIIWDALADKQRSPKALKTIQQADEHNVLIISNISIWEISMLFKNGRIELANTAANFVDLFLQTRNVAVIEISPEIAELSVNFSSDRNNDPTDRIIAATSIIHNAQLVTVDKNLIKSQIVKTLW